MIKVNLAPSSAIKGGSGGLLGGGDEAIFVSPEEIRKELLKRVVIVLMGPLGLYFYQDQIIPEKAAILSEKETTFQQLSAYNAQSAQIVERNKKLNATKVIYDQRLQAIDDLRKNRYQEVKVLDVLQKSMPETLWFIEVEMRSDRIIVKGLSMSDADTTRFLEEVNKNSFIKEVRLLGSADATIEGKTVKRFEVECYFNQLALSGGGS